MDNRNKEEIIKKIFDHAVALKKAGKSDSQIKEDLLQKGIDENSSNEVIEKIKTIDLFNYQGGEGLGEISEEKESSGISGVLILVVILIVVNIMSASFDWPFWIY